MQKFLFAVCLLFFSFLVMGQNPEYEAKKAHIFTNAPVIVECLPIPSTKVIYTNEGKTIQYYTIKCVPTHYLRGVGPIDTFTVLYGIDSNYVAPVNYGTEEEPLWMVRLRTPSHGESDFPCTAVSDGNISIFFCKPLEEQIKTEQGVVADFMIFDSEYSGVLSLKDGSVNGCKEMKYEKVEQFFEELGQYGGVNNPGKSFYGRKTDREMKRNYEEYQMRRRKSKSYLIDSTEFKKIQEKEIKRSGGINYRNKAGGSRSATFMDTTFTIIVKNQSLEKITEAQYKYSFEVYGKCSKSGLNFEQSLLFMEYNSAALGYNIVMNEPTNNIMVEKGPDMEDDTLFNIAMNDYNDTTIAVSLIYVGIPSPMTMFANSEFLMYTVSLLIDSSACEENALRRFVNLPSMELLSWYSKDNVTEYSYNFLFTEGPDVYTLCPQPVITSSFSSVTGARAGISYVLDIHGQHFGDTRGNGRVLFSDAEKNTFYPNQNSNGSFLKGLDDYYYLLWSDDLIQVMIPSVVKEGYSGLAPGIAGSGKIRVVRDDEKFAVSPDSLNIEYAIINNDVFGTDVSSITYPYPYYLANQYCINGLVFTLDSSFLNIADTTNAIKDIDDALTAWSSHLSIALKLEKNSFGKPVYRKYNPNDKSRNFIILDYTMGGTNELMRTTDLDVFRDDIKKHYVLVKCNIRINSAYNWDFHYTQNDTKPAAKADFFSTFLHEVGHAIGLDHDVDRVNLFRNLMYYDVSDKLEVAANRITPTQYSDRAKTAASHHIVRSKNRVTDIPPHMIKLTDDTSLPNVAPPTISPVGPQIEVCTGRDTILTSSSFSNNYWLKAPNTPYGTTQSITVNSNSAAYFVRVYSVANGKCENASLISNIVNIKRKECAPPDSSIGPPKGPPFKDDNIAVRSLDADIQVKVYPNPSYGNIFVDIITPEWGNFNDRKFEVVVYDVLGNRYGSSALAPNSSHELNLSDMPSGHFTVQVISDGLIIFTDRLIKQ